MARTTIIEQDLDTGDIRVAGWFDQEKAERVDEETTWDGQQQVGVISGIPAQFGWSSLWRTAGGRWVIEVDAKRHYNGPHVYTFATDDEARDWLLRSGGEKAEQWLERYLGSVEPEAGPGRPAIGPTVKIVVPDDLLARAGEVAAAEGVARAEVLRRWLAAGAS